MERLTRRVNGVTCYTKGKYENTLACELEGSEIREILRRLAEYEETGLEPEEVARVNDFVGSQISHLLKCLAEERAKHEWIPANEPPETDDYILLSFENYSGLMIGRYEKNEDGGAYHLGDEGLALDHGLFVNAWMKLPERYKNHDDAILYMIDKDGVFDVYDSTYDITIHCSDGREQQQVVEKLNRTWIPCSRELPQDHTSVLATVKHRRWIGDLGTADETDHPEYLEVCAVHVCGDMYVKLDDSDHQCVTYIPLAEQEEDIECPIEEVIAWMPLPELYEEGENDR